MASAALPSPLMTYDADDAGGDAPLDLFLGTVVRSAPVADGGRLMRLDWPARAVVAAVDVRPENPTTSGDVNSRGNSRGCRGIAIVGDRIVHATYHSIEIRSLNLDLLARISDPLFVGLHEVAVEGSGLWVTATAIDGAARLDLATGAVGERLWPRSIPAVAAAFGAPAADFDPSVDNRLLHFGPNGSDLHLNAILPLDGDLLGLFNRFGAIVELRTGRMVIRDDRLAGSHNLVAIGGGLILVNRSTDAELLTVDVASGRIVATLDLKRLAYVAEVRSRAGDAGPDGPRLLFTRGLAFHRGRVFVGMAPGTILELDLAAGTLRGAMTLSLDPHVCIHGLAVRPRGTP